MNNSCIVFACTVLSETRLFVLKQFLDSFKKYFDDADIYIGINFGSIPEVEETIKAYNLKVVSIDRCLETQYAGSDASAYQIALHSLKKTNKEYKNYWFIHTKGAVNSHSDYLREWYINNFIADRYNVESLIEAYPSIGSYGKLGLEFDPNRKYSETDSEIPLFENIITEELPYTHSNFFYIHTLYVMSNKTMKKFFSLVTNKWFESKLDRYYFEGVFPFISSRAGYFPYIENRTSCTGVDLNIGLTNWINNNNLQEYHNLVNLYKTNFNFHQLNPPYVNSNA
jgi:hypothetical protein